MKKLKPKNIHLSEDCIKQLSKDAIDAGTDFKNYVQNHLEELAVRQKKKNWIGANVPSTWEVLLTENKEQMYRIGKKQKRAILTEDGHEVVVFNKGQEALAEKVCNLLNADLKVNKTSSSAVLAVSVCPRCKSDKITVAEITCSCDDCRNIFNGKLVYNVGHWRGCLNRANVLLAVRRLCDWRGGLLF